MSQIIEFNITKYKSSNAFVLIKSLTYFEDAEADPEINTPESISKISWEEVKAYFNEAVKRL